MTFIRIQFIYLFILNFSVANTINNPNINILKNIDFSNGNFDVLDSKNIKNHANFKFIDILNRVGSKVFNISNIDLFDNILIRGINSKVFIDGVNISDFKDLSILLYMNPMDLDNVEINRGISSAINFNTYMSDKLELKASIGYGDPFFKNGSENKMFGGYVSASDAYFDRKFKIKFSYEFNGSNGYKAYSSWVNSKEVGVNGYIPSISPTGDALYIVGNAGEINHIGHNFKLKSKINLGDNVLLDIWFNYSYYKHNSRNQETFLSKDNKPYFGDLSNNQNINSTLGDIPFSFVGNFGNQLYNQFIESIRYIHYFDKSNINIGLSRIDSNNIWLNPNSDANPFGGSGKKVVTYYQNTDLNLIYNMNLFDDKINLINVNLGSNFKLLQANINSNYISDWRYFNSAINSFNNKIYGKSYISSIFSNIEGNFLDSMFYLAFGIKFDHWLGFYNKSDFNQLSKNNNQKLAFLPRVSVGYKPINITNIKASFGSNFRAPNLSKMFSEYPYYDRVVSNNPNLQQENIMSLDIGLEQSLFYKGLFKAYYFFNDLNNFIYYSRSTNRFQNALKSKIHGIELSYNQPLPYNIGLYASYNFTYSRIVKNLVEQESVGKYLPNIPKHIGYVDLYYDDDIIYGSLGLEFRDKSFIYANNSDSISGVYGSMDRYILVNFKIGYNFDKHLAMSLDINNLLNNKYYTYYKAPGTSFYISLNTKL